MRSYDDRLILIFLLGSFALKFLAERLFGTFVCGVLKLLNTVLIDLSDKLLIEIIFIHEVSLTSARIKGH